MTDKLTPRQFSIDLRNALRDGSARPSPLALVPRNKRPFYEQVVIDYEATKQCHSPSGLTASIVAMWLKANRRSFTIRYGAELGCFSVIE